MLELLLILCLYIENVKSNCQNGTRFGLPWDKDLISLSIQRHNDAHDDNFDGCRREELQLPKLATRWGYTVETHDVITKDGYILQIHRIPYSRKKNQPIKDDRPVILIQHGILMSSSAWVSELPEQSAAFIFAENGFDVWLGNTRGNVYGQDHIDPNKDPKYFWDFSWEQMSEFDLPAMFDKIQEVTGREKLWYMGHSQGVTIMLAKLSSDPEFQKRVNAVFALAPVATVSNVQGTINMIMNSPTLVDSIKDFYSQDGEMQLPPFSKEIMFLSAPTCLIFPTFCSQLMFFFTGYSSQYNDSNSLIHSTITPEGTSLKNAWHWKQMFESGRFEKFDNSWKRRGGDKLYDQERPSEYDLALIKQTPFYVYTGADDQLSNEEDLRFFFEKLPSNILENHEHLENFVHIDFVWGLEAANKIYNPIVRIIKERASSQSFCSRQQKFPFSP